MPSSSRHRRRTRIVAIVVALAMVLSLLVSAIMALWSDPEPEQTPEQEGVQDEPVDDLYDELPEPDVLLYGDSLAVESVEHFRGALHQEHPDLEVLVAPLPGIAICDIEAAIQFDLEEAPPDVAVLEFAGNNQSPCVQGEDGEELTGEALADRYAEDAEAVTEVLTDADVQVVWVGVPPAPGLPGDASELIDQRYRDLVDDWEDRAPGLVHYAPAAEAVTGDDGEFVAELQCLDDEAAATDVDGDDVDGGEAGTAGGEEPAGCEDGQIPVRNEDEIHFCPTDYDDLGCLSYSSGARRYGEAMGDAVSDVLASA